MNKEQFKQAVATIQHLRSEQEPADFLIADPAAVAWLAAQIMRLERKVKRQQRMKRKKRRGYA